LALTTVSTHPYRYVSIIGRVVRLVDDDGTEMSALYLCYMGAVHAEPTRPMTNATIAIDRWTSYGFPPAG
jgi:hypothetical protein